jgi:hypothetical protein
MGDSFDVSILWEIKQEGHHLFVIVSLKQPVFCARFAFVYEQIGSFHVDETNIISVVTGVVVQNLFG